MPGPENPGPGINAGMPWGRIPGSRMPGGPVGLGCLGRLKLGYYQDARDDWDSRE